MNYKKMYEEQIETSSYYKRKFDRWYSIGFLSSITLISIILSLIIIQFIPILQQPNYHIYKNECYNETNLSVVGMCMNHCRITNPEAFKNFSCWDICFSIQVCNKIEVYEIWLKNYVIKYGKGFSGQYQVQEPISIKKSEITKEFLNDNCKPICIYYRNEWICNNEEYYIWNWNDNNGLKYKCGEDYEVVVK